MSSSGFGVLQYLLVLFGLVAGIFLAWWGGQTIERLHGIDTFRYSAMVAGDIGDDQLPALVPAQREQQPNHPLRSMDYGSIP